MYARSGRARGHEVLARPEGARSGGPVRGSYEDNPMNPNQRHEPGSLDSFPWCALAQAERSCFVVDVRVDGVALDEQERDQLIEPVRRGLAAFASDIALYRRSW